MKLVRYVSTQVIAYIIDIGSFIILLHFSGAGTVASNIIGKTSAGIFAFFVHRDFTFKLDKQEHKYTQAVKYFCLLGVNIPLSSLVLSLLLFFVKHAVAAKFISDTICLLLSFWLSKSWVFVSANNYDLPDSDKSPFL